MNSLIAKIVNRLNRLARFTRLNRVHSPRQHSAVATAGNLGCSVATPLRRHSATENGFSNPFIETTKTDKSVRSPLSAVKALASLCLCVSVLISSASAATYFVKPSGSDAAAGTSWATALGTVGRAISKASSGEEIWIAAGTYKEGVALTMKNGVGIYGGFAGTETAKSQRTAGNSTILDGNNTHRVFNNEFDEENPLTATAILDSVTVANGYTTGKGGGMYNFYASPTITKCTFSENFAEYDGGGGMYNYESSPTLTNCIFVGNAATNTQNYSANGGGMYNRENSSPTLTNCTFSKNEARHIGGGMYNYESSPTLTNCTFSENEAEHYGGMSNGYSSPILANCTFTGNSSSGWCGGMGNQESNPILTNCTFSENVAAWGGGGMYNASSSPTITNCTFSRNTALYGAGMFNLTAHPTLTNCTFSGNLAGDSGLGGGGMGNQESNPILTNCTFSGNEAAWGGGGMSNYESNPTLTNCIIWGNIAEEGAQIYDHGYPPSTITYSIVEGGYTGTGNKSTDPFLMPLANYGSNIETMPVQAGSSAIASGARQNQAPSGVTIPTTDAIGQPRNTSAACTIGAVEYVAVVGDRIVTFNGNDNTSGTAPSAITAASGSNVTLPAVGTLVKTGYTFAGWNANNSGTGTNYAAGASYTVPASDVTLYANWTPTGGTTYTLTFDAQGGTVMPTSMTFTSGTAITGLPTPTHTGYSFAGWQIDGAAIPATWTWTSNKTAIAQWTSATTYTVTLNPQGGMGGSISTLAIYNTPMPEGLSAPTLTGYTFLGYFDDTIGGNQYYSATMTSLCNWNKRNATTLYARWTIEFHPTIGTICDIPPIPEPIDIVIPVYTAKWLPPGLKINKDTGEITGIPTRAGIYTVAVIITDKFDKSKQETVLFSITIDALPAAAIGTFTGVIYDDYGDIAATWKMTASSSGKLTAQVVTVNPTTGKLVKLAFKAAAWQALDPAYLDIYTAEMTILDKKKNILHELFIEVNTGSEWDSLNASGEFSSLPLDFSFFVLEGQRNAFLDKFDKKLPLPEAQVFLTDYIGDWVAIYDTVADTWTTEKRKFAKGEAPVDKKYLTIKISKGGAIKYSGKLDDGKTKFSGASTLLNDEGDARMPIFNAIKNQVQPEADLIEIKN